MNGRPTVLPLAGARGRLSEDIRSFADEERCARTASQAAHFRTEGRVAASGERAHRIGRNGLISNSATFIGSASLKMMS